MAREMDWGGTAAIVHQLRCDRARLSQRARVLDRRQMADHNSQVPTLTFASIPYADNLKVAAIIDRGIPARALRELAEGLGMSVPAVAAAVRIPRRTLERRVGRNARLTFDETERAVRLGRVMAKAREVFEDASAAADWLAEPLRALGGHTPVELCATDAGAREVEQTLGRIEHGVFS
jgi:putative toxin-antitoxin system antitoxin component (TIGR02293 family)